LLGRCSFPNRRLSRAAARDATFFVRSATIGVFFATNLDCFRGRNGWLLRNWLPGRIFRRVICILVLEGLWRRRGPGGLFRFRALEQLVRRSRAFFRRRYGRSLRLSRAGGAFFSDGVRAIATRE